MLSKPTNAHKCMRV